MGGDLYIKCELISVEPAPGCGILLTGSPSTYKVLSGPHSLVGRRINVLVACIEMPLVQGDLGSFTVGTTYHLTLTRRNIHGIEAPASLPNDSWFYLKAASLGDLGPGSPFEPMPARGPAPGANG